VDNMSGSASLVDASVVWEETVESIVKKEGLEIFSPKDVRLISGLIPGAICIRRRPPSITDAPVKGFLLSMAVSKSEVLCQIWYVDESVEQKAPAINFGVFGIDNIDIVRSISDKIADALRIEAHASIIDCRPRYARN